MSKLDATVIRIRAGLVVASLLLATPLAVRGEGSEHLGPPLLPIASGTGIVSAGVGLEDHSGTMTLTVPAGVTIEQVIIYWGGFNDPGESGGGNPGTPSNGNTHGYGNYGSVTDWQSAGMDSPPKTLHLVIPPDNELAINGESVVGTLIGGPTHFYNPVEGSTFRADITDLNLVSPGINSLVITGLNFGVETHGAGIVVIYTKPGDPPAQIALRDGQDLAFYLFNPPIDTTVPQTFAYTPSVVARTANLTLMVGSVATNRPNKILVTIEGVTQTFTNLLTSAQGDQWDTLTLPITVPPRADDLKIQLLSASDGSPNLPASLVWITAALSVPGDGLDDCDTDGIPDDCELDCAAHGGQCGALYPTLCGRVADCNGNTRPDNCELAGHDCNVNGVLDACEPGGGACNDGDLCTVQDFCSNGVCVGVPRDCHTLDSQCTVGVCSPGTGACYAQPAHEGQSCNDGDACTADDICTNGACLGDGVTCNDHNPCTDDSCSPTDGCVYAPNDANTCGDHDACTGEDSCVAGVCLQTVPPQCDDGNPCTDDACDPVAGCVHTYNTNGCDDGDACTSHDACDQGDCVGEPIDCDDGNPCTDDACDPHSGCTTTPNSDPCNDDDACTEHDFCSNGACVGESIDCDDGNPCTDDACDPQLGCTTTFNTDPCDDGNACTGEDACSNGVCGGNPVVCDDHNSCTDDSCDPQIGCKTTFNTDPCDDQNACTDDDACAHGACAGSPIVCDDDNPCTDDACDPHTGCTVAYNTNGCDDDDACTEFDICSNGECVGEQVHCDDGNPCTDETCDPVLGCVVTSNTNGCDDGNACTEHDVCSQRVCQGAPIACDDGNSCTDDSCNPQTGCTVAFNTNGCNDGNACTEHDVCSQGACVGDSVHCDDGNPCTTDTCNPQTGCVTTFNTNGCDDGNLCTLEDVCSLGVCSGIPAVCEDGNPCTDNSCDPHVGCTLTYNTYDCNDGNACTEHDVCAQGSCNGAAITCNDGNPCTDDSCNPQTGCIVSFNTNGCDDANACTSADACVQGVCSGSPITCDDHNPCTDDSCDTTNGCVYTPDDSNSCDDGSVCNGVEICHTGQCQTGISLLCDDGDPCTDDACDPQAGCVKQFNTASCNDGNLCTTHDSCSDGNCQGEAVACQPGWQCDPLTGSCVNPSKRRGRVGEKGSILIFSKVEIRWTAGGALVQDTFISLLNDYPMPIGVQLYFVNGDGPLAANGSTGERAHPGYNKVDVKIDLTQNAPTYWSALTGQPQGVSPFTVLDPSTTAPGRPDPDGSGDRVLRGYIVAWAVNADDVEVCFNHLSGEATLVNYRDSAAWTYGAFAHKCVAANIGVGQPTGTPGILNLNDVEFEPGYDVLLLSFYAEGTNALSSGAQSALANSHLTLLPLDMDLRQETGGPTTTKATFTVWNQNETKLTGLDLCVTCWDQRFLARYGVPNHFLRTMLQSDHGKAQIDALASQLCNKDYDPSDGKPLGGDPRDVVSKATVLVGVEAKKLTRPTGAVIDEAGTNLVGMGQQNATIKYDVTASPPPELRSEP